MSPTRPRSSGVPAFQPLLRSVRPGLPTGVSAGTTTITAELTNTDGSVVSGTATVVISAYARAGASALAHHHSGSITVGNLQDTGQFLAIGTYSTAPYIRDLTNSPSLTWISDVPSVFPVDTNSGGNSGATAGIVTAFGNGSANIIAEATSSDGTIQTATATFNCPLVLPNRPATRQLRFLLSGFAGVCTAVDAHDLQRRLEHHQLEDHRSLRTGRRT